MKTYSAVVLYCTPGHKCRRRPLGGIVAKGTREARRKARDMFDGERARMVGKKNYVQATVIGITLAEIAAPPAPIQDGEQITVSLTGTVELERGDTILLRSPDRKASVRLKRVDVERKTGRRLAPPPPVVTVEYYSLYPNQYCYGAARPVATSQHGVDQLVQVRVTKHDGRIVDKQIV
jgi:hypothetical protein